MARKEEPKEAKPKEDETLKTKQDSVILKFNPEMPLS
jgi:hypothetical protein